MRGWHLFGAVLQSHRRTPPLTEVEPPAASGHWRFLRRPEIFTGFDALLWAERTASGLRKKPRPRRASFVNNFFTDVGYFCGNVRAVCVIVSPTNSPEATSRMISNITVSTVRKMCACNTAQPLSLRPRSSWQGGSPTPVASPRPGLSARGPDRGDFIPRTHDQGGLRARPGPPDQGRLRSPSGHPIDQAFAAMDRARGLPLGTPSPCFAAIRRPVVNLPLTQPEVS